MPEISLALGGGGIKGIAHIGVLNVLERTGIKVRAVAGTSAGGIIGAAFSSGLGSDRIKEIILKMDQKSLFQRGKNEGPAILGLAGLTNLLTEVLGDRLISDLKIPFACTAVDLDAGQEIILTQGRVVDAILATIAVPGVFPPKLWNGHTLVDGGVLDPVPIALARWLAPKLPVVAVFLSPPPENWRELAPIELPINAPIPQPILERISRLRISQAIRIFGESYDISTRMLGELRVQMDHPDVLIRPDVKEFGIVDQVNPEILIQRGISAAERAVPDIMKSCSWKNRIPRYFLHVSPPGKILEPHDEDETKQDQAS